MSAFPPVPLVSGTAAPLLRANVDTDAIIPSREITGVAKTGLADGLFAGWRYVASGSRVPDPDFVLNDPAFAGATILTQRVCAQDYSWLLNAQTPPNR